MMRAAREEANRWIAEAEKDLRDAELLLLHEGHYPLCRLTYLAAEKAMRAWLCANGRDVSGAAGLAALTRQVTSIEPALGPLTGSLCALEQFAPSGQGSESHAAPPAPSPLYSRELSRQAIALAERAVAQAKRSLSMPA
jgi:HEPN domain-containing protein